MASQGHARKCTLGRPAEGSQRRAPGAAPRPGALNAGLPAAPRLHGPGSPCRSGPRLRCSWEPHTRQPCPRSRRPPSATGTATTVGPWEQPAHQPCFLGWFFRKFTHALALSLLPGAIGDKDPLSPLSHLCTKEAACDRAVTAPGTGPTAATAEALGQLVLEPSRFFTEPRWGLASVRGNWEAGTRARRLSARSTGPSGHLHPCPRLPTAHCKARAGH